MNEALKIAQQNEIDALREENSRLRADNHRQLEQLSKEGEIRTAAQLEKLNQAEFEKAWNEGRIG